MAEFSVVMKHAKRMCKEFGNDCTGCGLADSHCPLGPIPENMDADFAHIERIVMDWAEKHPEPRYPTWAEWQKANFPNALHDICPNYFMPKKPLGTCATPCERCRNTPIPADIAEKLGVKPIGG